jgi:hypothetical protein
MHNTGRQRRELFSVPSRYIEMAAFDRLPASIRRALQFAPLPFSAVEVTALLDRFSEAEILKLIREFKG